MLSKKQFTDSLDFLETHQDALKCVDEIAEKRQSFLHYKTTTSNLVNAMANKEISIQGSSVVKAENSASFLYA